jgi:hypothetical protein
MNKQILRNKTIVLLTLLISFCTSCVQIQRSDKIQPVVEAEELKSKDSDDIHVFVFKPTFRTYQETVRYEAIGSNISSFDQVLNRIKSRARKDGCEALVQVKFYRQVYGNGRLGSSFPKIEAVGVRYTDGVEQQSSVKNTTNYSSLVYKLKD